MILGKCRQHSGGGDSVPNKTVVLSLVSRPPELHRQPLAERYVNLSIHTAPIKQTLLPSQPANEKTMLDSAWLCLVQTTWPSTYDNETFYIFVSPI